MNKRFVYAMRSLGKGHTTAKRFCALNMPPPPQPTAYRACNIALAKATKAVAVKTMRDAANELRNNPFQEINTCVLFPAMEHGKDRDIVQERVCHNTVNKNGKCLQYTEYFGDGDSKAYTEVENVYDGIHVEKQRIC